MKKIIISLIAVFTIFSTANASRISPEGKKVVAGVAVARVICHDMPKTMGGEGHPYFAYVSLSMAAANAIDDLGIFDKAVDCVKADYDNYKTEGWPAKTWEEAKQSINNYDSLGKLDKCKVGAAYGAYTVYRHVADTCFKVYDNCPSVAQIKQAASSRYHEFCNEFKNGLADGKDAINNAYYSAKKSFDVWRTGSLDPFDHIDHIQNFNPAPCPGSTPIPLYM